MSLSISDRGLRFLVKEEGYVPRKYIDPAGYPTIGVGHLLREDELAGGFVWIRGEQTPFANGLTPDEVKMLLDDDTNWSERVVNEQVQSASPLNQDQFDALVSFVFNVGPANFMRSGLLRALNANNFSVVPAEMAKWVYSRGKRMPGLVKRRRNEGLLFQGKFKI